MPKARRWSLIRSKVIHIWFWMKLTVLLINTFLKHPMWLHFILYIYPFNIMAFTKWNCFIRVQYWHSFGAMHVFSVWPCPTSPTSWPTQVKSVWFSLQLHFVRIITINVRIITINVFVFCNCINCEDFNGFISLEVEHQKSCWLQKI